jgi:hypothetical protein
LLAIRPDDLEFQAEVLLRKRFELVSRMIPETALACSYLCTFPVVAGAELHLYFALWLLRFTFHVLLLTFHLAIWQRAPP